MGVDWGQMKGGGDTSTEKPVRRGKARGQSRTDSRPTSPASGVSCEGDSEVDGEPQVVTKQRRKAKAMEQRRKGNFTEQEERMLIKLMIPHIEELEADHNAGHSSGANAGRNRIWDRALDTLNAQSNVHRTRDGIKKKFSALKTKATSDYIFNQDIPTGNCETARINQTPEEYLLARWYVDRQLPRVDGIEGGYESLSTINNVQMSSDGILVAPDTSGNLHPVVVSNAGEGLSGLVLSILTPQRICPLLPRR